ncbi:D-alanyl-D-alanine carboxypeptidase [Candidatus Falkowbacteria bacterium]|jgi:serine-type D-Ala-D-Ala endopeptidase (penicillin-binding protein 7)|nr:D-alanyl-D-alanine carboxypeptidase [Candidatus Falkowbacteria bacterium]MBT4433416.1 D-alanyl-D-alanine carboxypeptidase [Candidatus Falkowbacteria bacterium]
MPYILILAIFLNALIPVNTQDTSELPSKINSESVGISVTAKSALVIDKKSNKILFSKNKDKVLSIASITKLMSALVLLDRNLDWSDHVVIEKQDRKEGGRIYLGYGETVTVEDLFNLGLIASDNQAITALVRASGLTEDEFVDLMNEKSLEIQMKNSKFFDPTGLDPRNVSTSLDLVILAKEVFEREELTNILSKKEYSLKEIKTKRFIRIFSTNKFFDFTDKKSEYLLLAGKTGYLDEAGYCFLSQFKDSQGNEVITVILGSNSGKTRFQETKGLIWWIFNNWSWE